MTRAYQTLSALLIVTAASCWLTSSPAQARSEDKLTTKKIQLSITHPGFKSKEAETHGLSVVMNNQGDPLSYHMDVRSVFCSDEKCDVIALEMEWDALGRYQNYQMAYGDSLTKYDHEPFDTRDYSTFDTLMRNHGSVLSDLEPHHIIIKKKTAKGKKPGTKAAPAGIAGKSDVLQKVDAVSGATATYIKEEVVEGAAYTCYTMWHWANGNTSAKIRHYSQDNGSEAWLIGMLESDDPDHISFGLEAITRRKLFAPEIQKKAINAAASCTHHDFKQLLRYLEVASANTKDLFKAYEQLLSTSASARRITIMERILNHHQESPEAFHDAVSSYVITFHTFYEVQLYLRMVDTHKAGSKKVLRNVAPLLQHDNYFIARRAFDFLKTKELPDTLQKDIAVFEKRHNRSRAD